ncbi:unnamed protein product [Amaranthus hypochondriacus]
MPSYTNINTTNWNYTDLDIAQKFLFFNVLKDGRIHVFLPPVVKIPPSSYTSSGVLIKDVDISSDLSLRIFLPSCTSSGIKLPVFFYIHGGAYCTGSAFSEEYTRFVADITVKANVISVSIEYSLFPERKLPACYDQVWAALQWVASHNNGSGPDPWINHHADLHRIFISGDSVGGNMSHFLLAKVGSLGMGLPGYAKVEGMILIHPYFAERDENWMYMCPNNEGPQDSRMKPAVEDLARIGCNKVLVIVAENDRFGLYNIGANYVEDLKSSGWEGTVEMMVNKGKDHCFMFSDHLDAEAVAVRKRIVSFINNEDLES